MGFRLLEQLSHCSYLVDCRRLIARILSRGFIFHTEIVHKARAAADLPLPAFLLHPIQAVYPLYQVEVEVND
jgi:hypothetical protein